MLPKNFNPMISMIKPVGPSIHKAILILMVLISSSAAFANSSYKDLNSPEVKSFIDSNNYCVTHIEDEAVTEHNCKVSRNPLKSCSAFSCSFEFQTWNDNESQKYTYEIGDSNCEDRTHFKWLSYGFNAPLDTINLTILMNKALEKANSALSNLKSNMCK